MSGVVQVLGWEVDHRLVKLVEVKRRINNVSVRIFLMVFFFVLLRFFEIVSMVVIVMRMLVMKVLYSSLAEIRWLFAFVSWCLSE